MKSNLPVGWEWTTLGEIADWGSGGTPTAGNTSYYGGDIPWLIIGDLNDGYVNSSAKTITQKGLENSSAKKVPIGSVLIAMYGSIGKLGIANIECTTNQAIAFTKRIKLGIPNRFLFYYLFSQKAALLKMGKGGAQANISQTVLKDVPFPLPPLPEQHRIVAQLEATMQKLEASQERLEKLPVLLKKFRQAVLAAAVSGKLTEAWRAEQPQGGETGAELLDRIRAERRAQWEQKQRAKLSGKQLSLNDDWKKKYQEPEAIDSSELHELPEGWTWAQVGDVFSKVSDGPFGSNLKSDDYIEEPGFQVIRLENIGWMEFLAEKETFISEEKFLSLEKHEVVEGDIIFSSFVAGNIRAVLLGELPYKAINKADCFCLRDEYELTCTEYLEMALSSEESFRTLSSTVHGSTRPRINTTQLKALPVPLPSLEEQQEIVRQVHHYFDLANQLEARFELAAALVEQLPQALLAKAFSGQLVPQDPNDEPASALLERLKAEVAAPAKGKRGRKPKAMADAPLFE